MLWSIKVKYYGVNRTWVEEEWAKRRCPVDGVVLERLLNECMGRKDRNLDTGVEEVYLWEAAISRGLFLACAWILPNSIKLPRGGANLPRRAYDWRESPDFRVILTARLGKIAWFLH